jgi:FkbH-like protein
MKPEAFLLEVYNPTEHTINIQLSMSLSKEVRKDCPQLIQLNSPNSTFKTTVVLNSGYSRHEFPCHAFEAVTESGLPFDIALTPEADSAVRLVFLTADFVNYQEKKTSLQLKPDIKCVVWDLDNTLWEGVLIENDSVKLNPRIVKTIKQLDERGILLSIASKNDHAAAFKKLEDLGISVYFLYPQISWAQKSQSVRNIAKHLNIGLDTFAFIDDNPFELEEVSYSLPEVTCINVNDVGNVLSDLRFKGSDSADAKHRRKYYQETILREQQQSKFEDDYLGFLAACEIRLEIKTYSASDLERVAELVQRTNQLNFSGRKYTRAELSTILANSRLEKYVLQCSDKYGSYGTVGFGIVSHGANELRIEDFMLSCRVQGKLIEQAFFCHLKEHHNPHHATILHVNFRETSRNKPARDVLESLHFTKAAEPSEGVLLDLAHNPLVCQFISVTCLVPTLDSTPNNKFSGTMST